MQTVSIGNLVIGGGKLTVLAGPCTAESLELCCEVAEYMQKLCLELDVNYIFKASFDKANRTSGSSVRGPGMEKGLEYLAEVRRRYQVPVVTDIHEPYEAEIAAEVVDLLQIPAFLCRQTDLLQAAARTGKAVNIKKGQFMAPEDMKGAVEKIRLAGGNAVMLTERGSSFGYHNLVVDMRSFDIMRRNGVPVIFDATHSVQLPGGLGGASGGQREFIAPLARAAAAAGIDGLFTEVHPRPEKAFSDGPNSLDFAGIRTVLTQVKEIHETVQKYF
ncbi:MAG: 3-deoxy-8-phosphooctulonate synthase [Victivallaceae bacterium]|nr:3-deoxy-8-phosphooctulonate synthase [Victivallaceae bacterium]